VDRERHDAGDCRYTDEDAETVSTEHGNLQRSVSDGRPTGRPGILPG